MNRFISKATAVVTLSFLAVSATPAGAQQMDQISIEGVARVFDPDAPGGPNLAVDFLSGNPPTVIGATRGDITAEQGFGYFASLNPQSPGTIADLTINNAGVVGTPIANFITLTGPMGGYTFNLQGTDPGTTFGPITLQAQGPNTVAFFSVRGQVTGMNQTRDYVGVFTAQFSNMTPAQVFNAVNTGSTLPVTFSATLSAQAVIPEPSTYALMATGLGMLGFVARRRRTQV